MEFVQLKCPNCNADLRVENNLDSFYCQYCGTKILVQGQDRAAVLSKGIVNIMDKYNEIKKDEYERKREAKKENGKLTLIICIVCGIGAALCFLVSYLLMSGIL